MFPKKIQKLTKKQQKIRDAFMEFWLKELPKKYVYMEKFNHEYPLRSYSERARKTLEIGAGVGSHIPFEDLGNQTYYALELRKDLAKIIKSRIVNAGRVKIVVGDCQKYLPFKNNFFDRIIAIHVLEHLPNLSRALNEVVRVLKKDGLFSVVIPCEGGLVYSFAREISAKRLFKKKFPGESYDWLIKSEHVNMPGEIIAELQNFFVIENMAYFPLGVPCINLNLAIGLTLRLKAENKQLYI